jgi:hypothetical protein
VSYGVAAAALHELMLTSTEDARMHSIAANCAANSGIWARLPLDLKPGQHGPRGAEAHILISVLEYINNSPRLDRAWYVRVCEQAFVVLFVVQPRLHAVAVRGAQAAQCGVSTAHGMGLGTTEPQRCLSQVLTGSSQVAWALHAACCQVPDMTRHNGVAQLLLAGLGIDSACS